MTDLEKILADYAATQDCHSSFEFQRLQTAVAHIPELVREVEALRRECRAENGGVAHEKPLLALEM